MSTIISITNQKGGVGKTTTAACLASGLFATGKKVLCIDLDPQGNLGFCLGLEGPAPVTLYEALLKSVPAVSCILHTDYADIIPSDILLGSADVKLVGEGREMRLKEILSPFSTFYDYIIIDTPPALNILTVNAYVVSNHTIIPMFPEVLSLVGVSQIKETIKTVRNTFNPGLNVLGILLTRYNGRTRLSREMSELAQTMASLLQSHVFQTKIRNGVAAAESPAHGKPVNIHSPSSNPGMDYAAFTKEVLYDLSLYNGQPPAVKSFQKEEA